MFSPAVCSPAFAPVTPSLSERRTQPQYPFTSSQGVPVLRSASAEPVAAPDRFHCGSPSVLVEPVNVDDAFQVVGLVFQAAGEFVLPLDPDRLAIGVEALHGGVGRTFRWIPQPWH